MSEAQSSEQQLLIAGEWVGAAHDRTFEKSDPYTGEVATVAAAASVDDAERAVDAAAAAFPVWSATPPSRRRELLNAAADLLVSRAEEIAKTMIAECGATFGWGMFNCHAAAQFLRQAGSQALLPAGQMIPSDVPGVTAMSVRAPLGVIVGIAPWNAPVILAVRAVAAPLAYGNSVVLKGSEQCPRTHGAVARAIQDAELPAGAINFIANDPTDASAVVDALIAHPQVRRVNFTGSTRVGKIVAAKAAAHLKRTLLELGGKAPMIVLADADIDEAIHAATFGAFMNSGQICMSTERIVVEQAIAEDFADRLSRAAEALPVGDPRDPETKIGPVINQDSADRIAALLEDAKGKGARVRTGGRIEGTLVAPTVLTGVVPDMDIYYQESFGPVASVIEVADVDEAVRVANDTEYGLAAAVFSRDLDKAMAVAGRIESGICHVNSATVHDEPQMPFGGVKASGWGRFGGQASLDEFTELRWLSVQSGARAYPI